MSGPGVNCPLRLSPYFLFIPAMISAKPTLPPNAPGPHCPLSVPSFLAPSMSCAKVGAVAPCRRSTATALRCVATIAIMQRQILKSRIIARPSYYLVHSIDWTRGLFQNRKTGLLSSRESHDVLRVDREVKLPVFLCRNAAPFSYQQLIADFYAIDELVSEKSAGPESSLQDIGIGHAAILNDGERFRTKTDEDIFTWARRFSDAQSANWRICQRRFDDLTFEPVNRAKELRHFSPCRAMVQFHGTPDLQQFA